MGFIGSMLGGGSNFQAQSAQNLANPASGINLNLGNSQIQSGITQQQNLANALAAQNGTANQSAVYNQLGQIASGQGPNPAAAMLAQQTGQNVANQSALMAGQRGASQNAGLIARQAGQQGAATEQQAVGQGATMQANQSLGALGQQAGIAGQQVGQQANAIGALNQQLLGNQQLGVNAANMYNQTQVANAQQQNAANAQIAAGAQTQQGNILGGVAGAAGSALGLAGGGMVQHYDSGGYAYSNPYAPQSGSAGGPQSSFGQAIAGGGPNNTQAAGFNQLGSALGAGLRSGIKSLFSSSPTPIANQAMNQTAANSQLLGGPTPSTASLGVDTQLTPPTTAAGVTANTPQTGAPGLGVDTQFSDPGASLMSGLAHGGKVPAMVSPQEKILPPEEVKKVERGEKPAIEAGRTVPGKARVKGDSLKNDNVPMNLSEGSIVLPRSVTQSKTPGKDAQKFVEALLSKQGKGKRAA